MTKELEQQKGFAGSDGKADVLPAAVPVGNPTACADYTALLFEIISRLYPDILFGEVAGDRLMKINIQQDAPRIRISLKGEGILRLGYIDVIARRGKKLVSVGKTAKLTASSVASGAQSRFKRRTLVRKQTARNGLQTLKETNPHVILDFLKGTEIAEIVLYLGAVSDLTRNQPLVVELDRGGVWTPVYDHEDTLIEAAKITARQARMGRHDLQPELAAVIDLIVWDVILGRYFSAAQRMKVRGIATRQEKNAIVKVLNTQLLLSRRVEWTNHGVKKSFRFWSFDEKRAYLEFTMRVISEIAKCGFQACLGYGSVLSIIRDSDFIPHDDDMDILVTAPRDSYPYLPLFLEDLVGRLRSLGYTASPVKNGTHAHVALRGGGKGSALKAADVFVGFQESEHVSWFPGNRAVLQEHDVFPPSEVELFGVNCLIPRNPDVYLAAVYGDDWRTPKPRWHHPPSLKQYSDWFP